MVCDLTISLDERLAIQVRRRAEAHGLSVSAFVGKTLEDALKRRGPVSSRPFRLIVVGGDGPVLTIAPESPRALEVADDERCFRRGER